MADGIIIWARIIASLRREPGDTLDNHPEREQIREHRCNAENERAQSVSSGLPFSISQILSSSQAIWPS